MEWIFLDNFTYTPPDSPTPTNPSQMHLDAAGPTKPHRPDIGWWYYDGSVAIVTVNNTLRANTWEGSAKANPIEVLPTSDDFYVRVTYKHYTAVAYSGQRLVLGDIANGYQIECYKNGANTNVWTLNRYASGAATAIGDTTYTAAFADGDVAEFYNLGDHKLFYVNGTKRIEATDATYGSRTIRYAPYAVNGGMSDGAGTHVKQLGVAMLAKVPIGSSDKVLRSLSIVCDDEFGARIVRPGDLFEFNVSNTTHVILKLDGKSCVAPLNNTCQLRVYVDGVLAASHTYSSTSRSVIVRGLSTAVHRIKVVAPLRSGNRFDGQVRILSCLVDPGAVLEDPPTYASGHIIACGDSIVDAMKAGSGNTHDTELGYVQLAANSVGARVSHLSVPGWGYQQATSWGYPAFESSWHLAMRNRPYGSWAGVTLFYLNMGQNVGGGLTATMLQTILTAVRAKLVADGSPSAAIEVHVPFSGSQSAAITSEFNAYVAASGDTRAYLTPTDATKTTYASQIPTYSPTGDGVHPNTAGNAGLAPLIAAKWVTLIIPPSVTPSPLVPPKMRYRVLP